MKTIIHVNQHIIKHNKKFNKRLPTITVKQGKRNTYCTHVSIDGPSKVVYSDIPLSCGATVWIETESDITMTDIMNYKDLKKSMLHEKPSINKGSV